MPKSVYSQTREDSTYLLSDAAKYYKENNFESALECYNSIIRLYPAPVEYSQSLDNLYTAIGGKIDCLFSIGLHGDAADLINSSLFHPNIKSNISFLVAYGSIAAFYSKYDEAISSLLQAVVLDQKNKRVKQLLTSLLRTDQGYSIYQSSMPLTEVSSSAYALIATFAKDFSELDVSIRLYNDALSMRGYSSSLILNLVHVHEVKCDYFSAFHALVNFCEENRSLRVGARGFSCQELLESLSSTPDRKLIDSYNTRVEPIFRWIPESRASSTDGRIVSQDSYLEINLSEDRESGNTLFI